MTSPNSPADGGAAAPTVSESHLALPPITQISPRQPNLRSKLQAVTRTLGRVTLLRKRLPLLKRADDSMARNHALQPGATQHAPRRKWRRGSSVPDTGQLSMRRGGTRDSDEIEAERRRHHHHHKYRNRYKDIDTRCILWKVSPWNGKLFQSTAPHPLWIPQSCENCLKALHELNKHLEGKFRLVAKLAILCSRQANAHILRNKLYDEISPYINSLAFHDYEVKVEMDLMFDPSQFKADKQLRVPEETSRILRGHPYQRNGRELYNAQIALRNIKSFAEYPMRMQRLIVQVGMYERYEAKRVIVRQGHPASNFYFLLSGSVVVMVSDVETKVARPVAYLEKGMTFGELAIINRTNRQSTVIAKETVELLSLDVQDFHRIFMAGGVKNVNDPDHNEFIRSVGFLQGWPIPYLAQQPKKCIFHYFKRGDVLVKDSTYSNWIYIVKSGSLRVLKKLKRVDAFEGRKRHHQDSDPEKGFKSERQLRDERDMREKQRRYVLPDIKIPLRRIDDDDENTDDDVTPRVHISLTDFLSTEPRKHSMALTRPRMRRTGIHVLESEAQIASDDDDEEEEGLPEVKSALTRGLSWSNDLDHCRDVRRGSQSVNRLEALDIINPTSTHNSERARRSVHSDSVDFKGLLLRDGRESVNTASSPPGTIQSVYSSVDSATGVSSGSPFKRNSALLAYRVKQKLKHKSKREQEAEEVEREMKGRKQEVRTITHDLDAANILKQRQGQGPADLSAADLDPVFVHVQTLTKGQAFGVAETVLGAQPSLCVMSNGAECVMLDKQFYLQHAPEALVRRLRQEECPYPSDDQMQAGLQDNVDWGAYKSATFRHTVNLLRRNQKMVR